MVYDLQQKGEQLVIRCNIKWQILVWKPCFELNETYTARLDMHSSVRCSRRRISNIWKSSIAGYCHSFVGLVDVSNNCILLLAEDIVDSREDHRFLQVEELYFLQMGNSGSFERFCHLRVCWTSRYRRSNQFDILSVLTSTSSLRRVDDFHCRLWRPFTIVPAIAGTLPLDDEAWTLTVDLWGQIAVTALRYQTSLEQLLYAPNFSNNPFIIG